MNNPLYPQDKPQFGNRMTVIGHFFELRSRLIKCIIPLILFSIVSYFFFEKILELLKKPYPHNLVFVTPLEPFNAVLEVSIFGGIVLSLPVILFQLWKFVAPGLNEKERKYAIVYIPAGIILFLTGLLFCYYIFLPIGLKFLLGFGTNVFQPMVSVSSYLSFVLVMALVFGVTFELPLAAVILTKLGIVNYRFLSQNRRIAIVIIFIIGGIITPGPDIFSQFSVAIPLLILYEASVWLSKLTK